MSLSIKFFIALFLINSSLAAKEIKPSFILKSRALVNDFVIDALKIYVANDEGSVEIFDLRERKKVGEIFLKPYLSTKQKWVNVKILSVDRLNEKTLILSTTQNGYRELWLHDGLKLTKLIDEKRKLVIKEARFLDEKNFALATLGYEIIRYTLNDDYKVYSRHIEESAFSDMALSEDKKTLATVSESGQMSIVDTKNGKILKQPKPLNLDNVYKVAYKGGNIITAGEDRRVGVYPKNKKPYFIKSDFLVYCVALSPSGELGVYSSNEDSDLVVFEIKSGKKIHTLTGQKAIPSTIKFFDENGLFSAGYSNEIYYWYLKDLNSSR